MSCCRNNMSMTSTRKINMSMYLGFVDTFMGRVHAVDMKEQTQSNILTYSTDNMGDLGYDG
jgi:hypothetical protein